MSLPRSFASVVTPLRIAIIQQTKCERGGRVGSDLALHTQPRHTIRRKQTKRWEWMLNLLSHKKTPRRESGYARSEAWSTLRPQERIWRLGTKGKATKNNSSSNKIPSKGCCCPRKTGRPRTGRRRAPASGYVFHRKKTPSNRPGGFVGVQQVAAHGVVFSSHIRYIISQRLRGSGLASAPICLVDFLLHITATTYAPLNFMRGVPTRTWVLRYAFLAYCIPQRP